MSGDACQRCRTSETGENWTNLELARSFYDRFVVRWSNSQRPWHWFRDFCAPIWESAGFPTGFPIFNWITGSVFDKHPAQPSNNFPWTILHRWPFPVGQPGYFTVRFLPSGDGKCVHRFVSSKGAMEPCDPLTWQTWYDGNPLWYRGFWNILTSG